MKKNNRRVVLAVVLILVVCAATIGGTIAWLTDKTDPVTNTFSPSDIEISLVETEDPVAGDLEEGEEWKAQLVPGAEYHKNPEVSVNGDKTNVDVYLFVKFTETNNNAGILEFTSNLTTANGWTMVEGTDEVWYREVKVEDEVKSWKLIANDTVVISDELTKDGMPTEANLPSLAYQAYAIQSENMDIATATAKAAEALGFTVSTGA